MVVRGVTFTRVYYDELSEYTCNINYVFGTVLATLYTVSKRTEHLAYKRICEFLNVTNEMQLLKTLLLSLLCMFRTLLTHHQELTKIVHAAFVSS